MSNPFSETLINPDDKSKVVVVRPSKPKQKEEPVIPAFDGKHALKKHFIDQKLTGETIDVVPLFGNYYRVHFRNADNGVLNSQRSLFVECDEKSIKIRERQ